MTLKNNLKITDGKVCCVKCETGKTTMLDEQCLLVGYLIFYYKCLKCGFKFKVVIDKHGIYKVYNLTKKELEEDKIKK